MIHVWQKCDSDGLIQQKLFKTSKGVLDEIAVEYDDMKNGNSHWFSSAEEAKSANFNLFKYNYSTKTIYIPLVEGKKLTRKYLLYQWKGNCFEYTGIK